MKTLHVPNIIHSEWWRNYIYLLLHVFSIQNNPRSVFKLAKNQISNQTWADVYLMAAVCRQETKPGFINYINSHVY